MEAVKFSRPVGYVFDPTDCELVGFYLCNKIANQLIPGTDYFIPEYDLYASEEPWQIWSFFKPRLGEERDDQDLYFFTKLKKKTLKSSKIDRSVGTGTWQGEDGGTDIIYNNQKIGSRKRFRYENKGSDQHGGWIMHEFSLDSSLLGPDQYNDYVLCRIRKNQTALKKNNRGKSQEADSEKKKKQKRSEVKEVDSEKKKKKRSKVKEVDSESLPLAALPATISSNTTTPTTSNTMVQQPSDLDNDGEFYNDEEYGSVICQFVYENQQNDSQQFPNINDMFSS